MGPRFGYIDKFARNDFMLWKFEMETMLKAKYLWGLIDGKEAKPNECNATILSTYAKNESQVLNIII
jgi:hypothetical protein